MRASTARNVLGTELEPCSLDPLTGFFRDGCCNTDQHDRGLHVICARLTAEFLEFSRSRGNDLITPRPEFGFPGLKPGDRWCLRALTSRSPDLRRSAGPPISSRLRRRPLPSQKQRPPSGGLRVRSEPGVGYLLYRYAEYIESIRVSCPAVNSNMHLSSV